MDRQQMDRFVEKFGWIRCFRCAASFSENQKMLVLTCRHTFCTRCFQKGCQMVDMNKRMAVCFECKQQAKFAQFNANLPAKFLKPFEKIGDSDMMRASRFQQQQWKWNLKHMSKKLQRKTEVMKQKKAQLAKKNMKLKAKHDEMYAELLESYSRDELERLLSIPFEDLQNMNLSPERESPNSSSSSSVRHLIDEYSPTSLYRQVLLKNASSSSSRNTQSTAFPNAQRIIPINNRPKNIHLEKVKQAEVRISQPVFNPYKQQQQQQQQQQHQRGQQNASQRPSAYGAYGAGDGRIGYGTQGGYHANAKPAANEFNARLDAFGDFTNM